MYKMRAAISYQLRECLHKNELAARIFVGKATPVFLEIDKYSRQRNLLNNYLLLDNYWKLTG